ncbi:MAG: leucine-rich repeat protein [Ruminococcus sp.]|nr:leucine-rich repeat protein [Ruminococcus sp.]
MKHRRLAAAVTAAAMALTAMSVAVPAATATDDPYGKEMFYVDDDGRYISYNGMLFEYSKENGVDYATCEGMKYRLEDGHAVLVSARANDFVYLPAMIPLPVPKGMIVDELPLAELWEIEDEVFMGNCSIRSASLPYTVRRVGYKAFYGCESLEYVDYPDTLTDIGGYAFACTPFADITTKYDSALVINGTAVSFRNGPIVILPEGTKRIADRFAEGSNIEYIGMPEGVEEIGENAFKDCQYLSDICLPKSLEKIADNAFYHSYHRNIYYAGTSVDFARIEIGEGNSFIDNGYPIDYAKPFPINKHDNNGLIYNTYGFKAGVAYCDPEVLGEVDIQEYFYKFEEQAVYTTSIEDYAFDGCRSMVSVRIPHMVDSIGVHAFNGCTALTDIYYDGTKDKWDKMLSKPILNDRVTIHFSDMRYSDSELYGYDGELSDGRDSYGEVYIGKDFKKIKKSAFEGNRDITSVTISQSMTEIGDRAFADCVNLKEITFTKSVTRFGKEVFDGCRKLTDVWFSGSEEDWNAIKDSVALPDKASVHFIAELKENQSLVIENNVLVNGSKAKGVIVIPDGVKEIGVDAFRNNKDITSVTIPESVKIIQSCAFAGCSALTEINGPDTYIELMEHAFGTDEGNQPQWYKDLADSGEEAVFAGNLLFAPDTEEYTVPGSVKVINHVGSMMRNLKKLTISEGVEAIYSSFSGCSSLEELKLPASLKKADVSFNSCDNIRKAEYAGSDSDWAKIQIYYSFNNGQLDIWNGGDTPLSSANNDPVSQQSSDLTDVPLVELKKDCEMELCVGEAVDISVYCEASDPVVQKLVSNLWINDYSGDVIWFDMQDTGKSGSGKYIVYRVYANSPGERRLAFNEFSETKDDLLCVTFKVLESKESPKKAGDANCDGKITVSDAVAVLQYIANNEKYPLSDEGMLNADIDGEKGITGGDAIAIQKMDAGLYP